MRSSPVLSLLSAVTDASQRNLEDVVQRSEREDTSGDSYGSKNESPWVARTHGAASYRQKIQGGPVYKDPSLSSRPVEETLLTSRSHKCPGMSDSPGCFYSMVGHCLPFCLLLILVLRSCVGESEEPPLQGSRVFRLIITWIMVTHIKGKWAIFLV